MPLPIPSCPGSAAVLLASHCSLRRGEILALRRGDVDLLYCTVTVRRAVVSLATGELFMGDPKTAAGRRMIAIPDVMVPALEDHSASHVAAPSDSLLFTGERGGPLRPQVLQSAWDEARRQAVLQYPHFHACGTTATPGRQPPARARQNSWPGWDTRALQLRRSISTPPPIAIGRSPLLSVSEKNHLPQCLRSPPPSVDPRDLTGAG